MADANNTTAWFNFAQQPVDQGGLGLAPHQAAGLIGNLVNESGQSLNPWGPTGDNGTAWGTAQWRGDRLNALKAMFPNSYQTIASQQAFMRHEMLGSENKAYRALIAAGSPEEAATAVNHLYERSADRTGGREAAARQLMASFGGDQGIGGTGRPALAFSGDDDEDTAIPTNAQSTSGTLGFAGDSGGAKDDRFSIGSLFGASDETKAKMHGFGARLARAAAALSSGVNPGQSAQLNALGKSLEDQNKTDYQYMMGPNGQLIKINKDTGAVNFATLPGGGKGSFGIVMGKDAMGRPTPIGKINHSTGDFTPYGAQTPQTQNSAFGVPVSETNPHGLPDDIESLKGSGKAGESLANQVQGVFNGDISYPAGGSRMNPQQLMLKDALALYYPNMNANDFNARKKFRETIANTAGNSRGAQYASLNHSYDLLSQAADSVEKLDNSDSAYVPVGLQQLYNGARNQQNSPNRSGAAKNIDTSLVPSLMGEQAKLYYGTNGGGQEERRVIGKSLTSGDTLTNQIEGLKTIRDQLVARQHVLESEADKGYGKGAEAYYPVDQRGQASLDKLNATIQRLEDKRSGRAKAAAAPATAPTAIPSNWADAQKAGWK